MGFIITSVVKADQQQLTALLERIQESSQALRDGSDD